MLLLPHCRPKDLSRSAKIVAGARPDGPLSYAALPIKIFPREDYYFVTHGEFEETVENGGFLEHATNYGNHYGTITCQPLHSLHGFKAHVKTLDRMSQCPYRDIVYSAFGIIA